MTSPSIPDPTPAWLDENQRMGDARGGPHVHSQWYDLDGFREGDLALDDIERSGVGEVHDCSLLHLQCHFGLGTLSWARLGAESVGVDFSATAIAQARDLAHMLTIPARFVQADVTTLRLGHLFDVVFTSWGVLMWLDDLTAWARTALLTCAPGTLFVAEGHPHPFIWDDTTGGTSLSQPLLSTDTCIDPEAGSYVDSRIRLGLPNTAGTTHSPKS